MPKRNRRRIISTSESESDDSVVRVDTQNRQQKRRRRESKFDELLSKLRDIEAEIRSNVSNEDNRESDKGTNFVF